MKTKPVRRFLLLLTLAGLGLLAASFAACTTAPAVPPTATPTRTPRPTETPIPPTPTPTPTPAWPVTVFIPLGLPRPVTAALENTVAAHPDFLAVTDAPDTADVRLVIWAADSPPDLSGAGLTVIAEWVYAVTAPFPTLTDAVAGADIAAAWSITATGPFAGRPLLLTTETAATLSAVWGSPAAESVHLVPEDEIVQRAWDSAPSWAIVPFDDLEPRWKVLRVDGLSVLDKDFDADAYPLTVRVGVTGEERGVAKLLELLAEQSPPERTAADRLFFTNRDPAKMTVLMLTGVTALTRATAVRMERNGVLYPAQDIRDWLTEPDLTHISNEVSFAEDCPPPGDYSTMTFCSSPRYMELLEYVDVDIVELTGNHLLDWGVEPMENSLRMYAERGIPYYGGGWNIAEARRPLTITSGMHTFGFVGCNPVGPSYDWATEEQPGSAPCDYDLLRAQVGQMREQGIIPIVTFQYLETYQYYPTPQQVADFRSLAEAGAVIVSGSQAHQPQGFDFYAGAFIHYGLGNLFFDQMQSLETRQEFLDRHVFYDGRHISTELLTALLEDYARPRPMTPEERAELLQAAFDASQW